VAVTTVFSVPDDGRKGHSKHVELLTPNKEHKKKLNLVGICMISINLLLDFHTWFQEELCTKFGDFLCFRISTFISNKWFLVIGFNNHNFFVIILCSPCILYVQCIRPQSFVVVIRKRKWKPCSFYLFS